MPEASPVDNAVEAAVAHHRAGRLAEAEQGYREALAVAPRHPRAAHNLGSLLLRRGEVEAAVELLQTAVDADPGGPWRPGYARALAELGFLRLRDGEAESARDALERSLEIAPDDVGVLVNLGTALRRLGRLDEAEARYRAALAREPGHRAAQANLATLPRPAGGEKPSLEALAPILAAAGADRSPATLAALANNLLAQGRPSEAGEAASRALALDAEEPEARYVRGLLRLAGGDFAGGWDDYERRGRMHNFAPTRRGPAERIAFDVDRAEVAGRDVLLLAEQGVGDEIMFASMIPDLAREARSVSCVCDPRLVRLFSASFPGVAFAAEAAPAPDALVLAIGSLGRLYRRDVAGFPGRPFLAPRREVAAGWAARLGPAPRGLRIGLSWRGGVRQTRMHLRSLGLADLAPLLDLPGCDYVSLQYGDVAEEVAQANAGLAAPIRLFPRQEIDDFEDLAGLVQALDVVVSVQTAVVHLAGALGRPCLTLVPHVAEWRYGASGPAMPWYGSVKLFRQPQPRDWPPVIDAARRDLVARLAENSS